MLAVANHGDWTTRAVVTGEPMDTYKAPELMRMIAESAYICGDPGMQYDTTINRWHTSKNTAPINASNPCSEYMFLDDSACNLASLNLMKFSGKEGRFDIESFRKAVDVTITAQEIIVGFASYPTNKIQINSFNFRPLGLGYANLGALLMSQGIAYDSDYGRDYAAAITAMMTGEAYLQSAKIAGELGPCAGFDVNRKPFLDVMRMHRDAVKRINRSNIPTDMYDAAWDVWSDAVDLGILHGYRNSQTTVLAPTGTIGFMMDCDTTGIEPDLALEKYKKPGAPGGASGVAESRPVRRHLPVERYSITHKFAVAGHEGYLTIGMYEDGTPGEIFIVMAKEGSTLSGVMDSFATTCSMALQYGVPLKVLVDKFSHTRFEPSGFTSNPQVPYAKSIMDYIFRYLASKFLPAQEARALGVQVDEPPLTPLAVNAPPRMPTAMPGSTPPKKR